MSLILIREDLAKRFLLGGLRRQDFEYDLDIEVLPSSIEQQYFAEALATDHYWSLSCCPGNAPSRAQNLEV